VSTVARQEPLPERIHIVIVVYGKRFCQLLADITLPNLAALVREIPAELRANSVVRILTTDADIATIRSSHAMEALQQSLRVEVLGALSMADFDKHGDYGPMVATQRRAVVEAARSNAVLFFVGPDQIYSKGSFAFFVHKLKEGYRVVIGPGVRVKRDSITRELRDKIARSPDGTFALSGKEQVEMFFRHWHPINDQFVMGSGKDFSWKAYIYYRPRPDELLIRFFQGPTLVAWPYGALDDFDGFIDHKLAMMCCRRPDEVCVVEDAAQCLALDMTEDTRRDVLPFAYFPQGDLLRQMFTRETMNEVQLRYGRNTCRVGVDQEPSSEVRRWAASFSDAVDPLISLALLERRISARVGKTLGACIRIFMLLNLNTLAWIARRATPGRLLKS